MISPPRAARAFVSRADAPGSEQFSRLRGDGTSRSARSSPNARIFERASCASQRQSTPCDASQASTSRTYGGAAASGVVAGASRAADVAANALRRGTRCGGCSAAHAPMRHMHARIVDVER